MADTWDSNMERLVQEGVLPNLLNRVLLFGPPRTGKSSIAGSLFTTHDRVTLHRQQPIDDMIGGYGLVNGTTQWQDGPVVRAMRKGTCVVLDEIDQFSPECRCILHAIMDDPPGVTLPTGERVNGKKGYCVIATTNALPSTLPAPILDRFDLILLANTMSAGLQEALGQLVNQAKNVIDRDKSYHWVRPASINLFLAAAKLRRGGLKDEQIVRAFGFTGKQATDTILALKG